MTAIPEPPGVPSSQASDLNDSSWVIGELNDEINAGTFAFAFDGTEVANLGTPPGGTYSQAHGINNAGQVVGNWCNNVTGPCPLAFLWQDGQMIDISADFGTPTSRARDINDSGQATGWMGSSVIADGNAFIWQEGQVKELPLPPGTYLCEGFGINNLGHVAGTARISNVVGPYQSHSVVWAAMKPMDIGALPSFSRSVAYDINDSGTVVGKSWYSGGNPSISRAFVWQNGVMIDLNDLIPSSLGVTIETAYGINNGGRIAANGKMGGGSTFAMLLTPLEVPVGDLDGDCTVGVTDFLALLAAWGPCPPSGGCPADLDGSGSVGIVDFLTLLANWG